MFCVRVVAFDVTFEMRQSNPRFFVYCQLSTEHNPEITEMTGPSVMATGMLEEQVAAIWEVDVFMQKVPKPQGYVVFRYANGRDFSGYMVDGVPNGYGVLRGPILTHIGEWENGQLIKGIMIDAVRGWQFDIPSEPSSPARLGPRGHPGTEGQ